MIGIPNLAQIYLKDLSTQAEGYYGVALCYSVTMATNMTSSDPYPQNAHTQ